MLLASAKSTFFAGAELKGVLQLKAEDAAEGFARIEAMKKSFRRLETLGRPVVALLERRGARRRLGGRARRRMRASRSTIAKIQLRHARGVARPDPRRDRHHEDGAAARPDGGAAVPARRQAVRPARGARARPRRRPRADSAAGLRAQRARLDRGASRARCSRGTDKDYRMPGGAPSNPKIAAGARGRAGDARAEDARPLSGARRRSSRRWSRARWSTTTPRRASRAASSRRLMVGADDEEHDHRLLLRPERDQVGQVAAAGLSRAGSRRRSACSAPA